MIIKNKYFLLIWIFSLLSFQSIGYDIYAHSLFHHYNYEKITYLSSFFFDEFLIPRYGLLSYIYEFFRNLGIPIGWVALLLIYIPVLSISKVSFNFAYRTNRLIFTTISLMIMGLIYFYSAMSLVIIWFLALFLTSKRFFLIGTMFHPAGFALGIFYVFLYTNRIKNLLILFAPIFFMLILSWLNINDYISLEFIDINNVRFNVELKILWDLFDFLLTNKPIEFSILLLVLFWGFFSRRTLISGEFIIKKNKNRISDPVYLFIFLLLYFILMLNSLLREGDSLFSSIINIKYSDNIYITWFNFGEREFVGTFIGVNNERF